MNTNQSTEFRPFTWRVMAQHDTIHPSMRPVLPSIGIAEVFVSHETPAQRDCMRQGHIMVALSKYGHGRCRKCAADGWSASFVCVGAMPIITEVNPATGKCEVVSDTGTFIAETLHRYRLAVGVTQ